MKEKLKDEKLVKVNGNASVDDIVGQVKAKLLPKVSLIVPLDKRETHRMSLFMYGISKYFQAANSNSK